jgi:LacI family transcriptional regulator
LLLQDAPSSGWQRVDGLLIHGRDPRAISERMGGEIPIVSLMTKAPAINSVSTDDRAGARLATEYLLELGHRQIAYLIYTGQGASILNDRLRGYQEALSEKNIEPHKSWVGELQNYGPMVKRGYLSMQHWLQNGWAELGCTALLVQNDRAAIGAMAALREAGVRVPQDLSVVGFDSTDECDLTVPSLTSVRVPLEELGAQAAALLIAQIENGKSVLQNIILPTQLQVRDSTAPPDSQVR